MPGFYLQMGKFWFVFVRGVASSFYHTVSTYVMYTVLSCSFSLTLPFYKAMLLAVMLCSILLWVLAGLWNAQSTHSPVTTQPPQGQLQDEDREAMVCL